MKTSIKAMFVAVAVASFFSSCAKNLGGDIENPKAGSVKAIVSANLNDMSKASLDGLKLKWEAGDELAVCQYGYYCKFEDKDLTRDKTLNKFTYNTGTGTFDGEIFDYHPTNEAQKGVDKYRERFYVAFPFSNLSKFGLTTARYTLITNKNQTGKAADFGKYATYLGYLRLRDEEKPITSYDGNVLTFLQPFNMTCINPILKLEVPEALSVNNIVVSALKGEDSAPIAGTFEARIDAKNMNTLPGENEIQISDGGNILSGDVYVVLAPNAMTPEEDKVHNNMSDITAIVLDLTKNDGAVARLKLTLKGTAPLSGVVKSLTLPESVTWTYPEGPGIATIGFVNNSGQAGKFEVTTENEGSTLKYSNSSVSYEEVEEPITKYPEGGIQRGENINYVRFCTTTGVLTPRIENAMIWGFSKTKGFGVNIFNNFKDNTVGASYTYAALTYTITTAGNTYAYPYCQSAGLNFMNTDNATVSKGYLSFSALEGGTGRIMIQSPGSGRTVTVTNVTKGTSVSKSLTSSQGVVVTDSFAVSKDDVIKVEFNKSVQVQSMSFVWETAVDK